MNSAIYEGIVRHRRFTPVENFFTYRMYMMYIDLDELPALFDGRLLWSTRRRNLAEFRRSDYHGPAERPLADAVRDTVERQTGRRPTGPIRLLTHLRYFGYIFNPVSFYYVHDDCGGLETILAEITNTPWSERRAHVLDPARNIEENPARRRYRFAKDFHVSPFFGMNFDYDWRFTVPGESLAVHMENWGGGRVAFDATMTLQRREMTSANLARVLLRYPFMTGKVIAAIYWQALKLWSRRVPFVAHPPVHTTNERTMGGEKALNSH